MADPSLIRQGIADALAGLGIQVSPYVLSSPTPPVAYVQLNSIEYDLANARGHDDWTFTLYVLVGFVSDIGAQKRLDTFLMSHGATSVKALLRADPTLGGAAMALRVLQTPAVRIYVNEGQPPMLGAEFTLIVTADGRE